MSQQVGQIIQSNTSSFDNKLLIYVRTVLSLLWHTLTKVLTSVQHSLLVIICHQQVVSYMLLTIT